MADQVGIQLLNGYPDAALILLRTFYEYALVLKLLAEQQNDQLTVKFMLHSNLQNNKLMESYQKRLAGEGFDRQ
jgi:hypothetical protein